MPTYDVIGLGALRQDQFYSTNTLSSVGELAIHPSASTSGGAAANTVFGLNRLGLRCGLIGAVGNDIAGRELVAELRKAGIESEGIVFIDNVPTDKALTICGGDGRHISYICSTAGNKLYIDEASLLALKDCLLIHIGGLAGVKQIESVAASLECVGTETMISLSISDNEAVFGLDAFKPIISRCSVLFASKSAMEKLTNKNYKHSERVCRKLGAKTVVVFLTCGEEIRKIRKKGKAASVTTYVRNHEYECLIESAVRKWPNIVEPTGAQDAFAAGFLFGMLKGRSIDDCGFLGDIVAQSCLKKPGARDSLPDAVEVSKRYFQIHREEISF